MVTMPNAHKWENRKKPPLDTTTPKCKGGGRSQHPHSLANLKKWQPGESGNPSGRSHTVMELTRLARTKSTDAIEVLYKLMMDDSGDTHARERIAAANILLERGCGRPAVGIFHGAGPGVPPGHQLLDGMEDGPATALLLAARAKPDEKALMELEAEARRIRAKLAQDRENYKAQLADEADALARGEDIDGMTLLLLRMKAEDHNVKTSNGASHGN